MPSRRSVLHGVAGSLAATGLAGCSADALWRDGPTFARPLFAPDAVGSQGGDKPSVRILRPSVVEAHANRLGTTPDWEFLSAPRGVDPEALSMYVAMGTRLVAGTGPFGADEVGRALGGTAGVEEREAYRGFDRYRYDGGTELRAVAIDERVYLGARTQTVAPPEAGDSLGGPQQRRTGDPMAVLEAAIDAWYGDTRYGDAVPAVGRVLDHLKGATTGTLTRPTPGPGGMQFGGDTNLVVAAHGIRLDGSRFVEILAFVFDGTVDETAVRRRAQSRYLNRLGERGPDVDVSDLMGDYETLDVDLPIEYGRDGTFVNARWEGPTSVLG